MRKQQIKLTESKILEAINDVITDYENSEDGLYDSAREAVKSNTGFERWFSTKALQVGIDKEEALNIYLNAKRDLESLQYMSPIYASEKQDELPDFNQNVYDYDNEYKFGVWAQEDNYDGGINRAVGKSKRPTHRQSRSEIDKYFIDDSRFDDIVNEAITNFMRSKTGKKFSKIREEEIDSPRFYGYDIDKHLGDVSPEQKKSDNEWSYEHAFDSSRNLGVTDGTIDSERLQSILDLPNANDSMDMRMTPSKYPYWVWSDENRNILDRHGRYSMCSQSDIPHVQEYGKGARDTLRATNAQRNQ